MSRVHGRRDRTARLLSLQMLLWQYPDGLKVKEIARRYATSTKTIYRDLKSLELELDVPIWEKGSKRGVVEGHFLPPISLSLTEAVNIFISIRLIQRLFHKYNPSVASVFMKLSTVVPLPLREQIQNTIEYMEQQPRDERKIKNFNKITEAWLSRKRVKIWYKGLRDTEPKERVIEPYFIEPIVWSHSNHIIAFCHLTESVRSYDIDRIIGDVSICPDTYEIPKDFNAIDYLSSAWSIYQDQEIYSVKLRFSQMYSGFVMSNTWHPSQKVELQPDGSLIMTLQTRDTIDFIAWVLGWGSDVEILEPKILRDQIVGIAQSILGIYNVDKLPGKALYREYRRNTPNTIPSELTDEQWELVSAILPARSCTGRPRADDRRTINGILWVLRNGVRWSDIPREYGTPSTCHSRFKSWQEQGVWMRILHTLDSNLE